MNQQRQDAEQRRPLLSGSNHNPHPISSYNATSAATRATGSTTYTQDDGYSSEDNRTSSTSEDDDPAAAKDQSTWRAWYRSILKFFQGLGKFFLILGLGTIVLVLVLQYTLPSVDEEHRKDLHFPHSLEDLEALRKILSVYMDKHYYRVLFGFLTIYLYLQTFSVPGSMWLSILGGALFKFWVALIIVSLASAIGATNCYLLSRMFFSKLVKRKFGDRMEKWNTQLQRHRNNLMSYIILLRLAPFPPNWFVNICSPHLNVPLWPEFFLGTLIGVSAPSVVHVQAGMVLEKLVEDHSSGVDVFTWKNFLMLGAVALLAALPVLIRWVLARYEAKKVGIDIDALDQEEEGGPVHASIANEDPILEPLDPTGVIIPPERQHFLRRTSSVSVNKTLHTPQQQQSPQLPR
ncbi:Transmembrane protein 41B [Linnemannia schmuckeri]|uniref:Transmembrane protein 41B n=1 Tax=Linnemannia schmuckeri TaxID=64567 RepID=A0A9P5VAY2_9FUNG|nr:Transmembrane protein 41B [Linnemannia schmuckeri]